MTKQQAIKELVKLGCSDPVPDGKFCIYITTPSGHRALADPRELLAEIAGTSPRSVRLTSQG